MQAILAFSDVPQTTHESKFPEISDKIKSLDIFLFLEFFLEKLLDKTLFIELLEDKCNKLNATYDS